MNNFETRIKEHRLVPVVSLPSIDAGVRLAEILVGCGMEVAEVTFRTAHAAAGICEMKKRYPNLLLLAGTVLTPEQVDAAVDSGAEAVVSPGLDPLMVNHCLNKGVPVLPGVCTPSEVQQALSLGLTRLKFFPAELSGGLKMVKMLLGVYRMLTLMPTGGINPDNLQDYLAVDRVLCCGGTWLAPESMMAAGEWDAIEQQVQAAVTILNV